MKKKSARNRIEISISVGFLFAISLSWWNEIYAYTFLQQNVTFNWQEPIFETAIMLGLAVMVVWHTHRTFNKLTYMEGFLATCASCKKIRVDDEWIAIEKYIQEHSAAEFTHSMCPTCTEEYYGDFLRSADPVTE